MYPFHKKNLTSNKNMGTLCKFSARMWSDSQKVFLKYMKLFFTDVN